MVARGRDLVHSCCKNWLGVFANRALKAVQLIRDAGTFLCHFTSYWLHRQQTAI